MRKKSPIITNKINKYTRLFNFSIIYRLQSQVFDRLYAYETFCSILTDLCLVHFHANEVTKLENLFVWRIYNFYYAKPQSMHSNFALFVREKKKFCLFSVHWLSKRLQELSIVLINILINFFSIRSNFDESKRGFIILRLYREFDDLTNEIVYRKYARLWF